MFKTKKGFTLIELLVVIAIIGILSAIVMASVNSARDKGSNSAVKGDLHGIKDQSEIVYDNNGQSYSAVCADPFVINAITNAINVGGDIGAVAADRCNNADDAWAVNALLKVPENGGADVYWCIDSTGISKGEAAELAGATVCG